MSFTYKCVHLLDGQTYERPSTFLNPHKTQPTGHYYIDPRVQSLHESLPDYGETKLHSLRHIAKELGFAHVFVKDESTRFRLPSFKISGASWAVYKVLCKHCGLSTDVSLDDLKQELARGQPVTLVTCTAGNWGRAVSRMAKILGVKAIVFVPQFTQEYTRSLITGEGADLRHLTNVDYDGALLVAESESKQPGSILVLDMSMDNYLEIPEWVTDGYSTILQETDRQVAALTDGRSVDLVTCSVGAGSWAQAVAMHYKNRASPAQLVTVEPDTAASLKEALHIGEIAQIRTGDTIMNGMNCGTISSVAWPTLKDNTDIATVVTDLEAHQSALELKEADINAGPCGAANLAALRRICREVNIAARDAMVVVLFSSEGMREYEVPKEGRSS